MTTEQNKAIVRRFYKAFEANDEVALNEVLSPDLVAYTHGEPGAQTREMMLQGIRMWNATFESHFTIADEIAEGDKVAVRMVFRTVHNRGDFRGVPPTGKQGEVESVTIERIKDGKIVERRVFNDWSELMQQLGLIPSPQAAK